MLINQCGQDNNVILFRIKKSDKKCILSLNKYILAFNGFRILTLKLKGKSQTGKFSDRRVILTLIVILTFCVFVTSFKLVRIKNILCTIIKFIYLMIISSKNIIIILNNLLLILCNYYYNFIFI